MILLSTAASADSVVQLWNCKVDDNKTPADVVAVSSAWLKAAKSMEGGEDLEVFVEFPMAANAAFGEFTFVLVSADAKTWGLFNNGYADSPAAEADEAWNAVASCSSSSLWESIKIE